MNLNTEPRLAGRGKQKIARVGKSFTFYSSMNSVGAQQVCREDGKPIGNASGDCLYKTCDASRHMMKNPPGWAIDLVALHQAVALNVVRVAILDRETGTIYRAPIQLFWEKGIEKNFPGHGAQLNLPLRYWTIEHPDQLLLPIEGM